MNTDILFENPFYTRRKIDWPEHWTNGGTGISKSDPPHTEQMADICQILGDPQVFMVGSELHSTRQPLDLSDFWKLYREKYPA